MTWQSDKDWQIKAFGLRITGLGCVVMMFIRYYNKAANLEDGFFNLYNTKRINHKKMTKKRVES